jgi:hypothetical protein
MELHSEEGGSRRLIVKPTLSGESAMTEALPAASA